MHKPTAVVALLLAAGIAGCVGDDQASAMDLRGTADDAAQDWQADARLVGVVGLEAPGEWVDEIEQEAVDEPEDDEQRFFLLLVRRDADLGDGRAHAWLFTYHSMSADRIFAVVVSADGRIEETRDLGDPDDVDDDLGGEPIGEWRIDSDTAASTLHDEADNFTAEAAEGVIWFLTGESMDDDSDHAMWVAVPPEGGSIHFVDAVNGTYLGSFGYGDLFEFDLMGAETGHFQGSLAVLVAQSDDFAFTIHEAGHGELLVTLSLDPDMPLSQVTVRLTGPGVAQDATAGAMVSLPGASLAQIAVPEPEPGVYAIEVTLDEGAAQDFEVSYCATGLYIHIDLTGFNRDPCARI